MKKIITLVLCLLMSFSILPGAFVETVAATKHTHSWDSGVVVTKATCKNAGKKKYTCKTCKATKTVEIKAKGHNYAAATCTKAKTCTRCGATTGSKLGHLLNSKRVCKRCKKFIGQTMTASDKKIAKRVGYMSENSPVYLDGGYLDYTFCLWDTDNSSKEIKNAKGFVSIKIKNNDGKVVYDGVKTFSKDNYSNGLYHVKVYLCEITPGTTKKGTVTVHIYNDYFGFESSTFKGYSILPVKNSTSAKNEHNWAKIKTLYAATCTEKGLALYRCSKCKSEKTVATAALGHISKGQNCTKAHTCTRCNATLKATKHKYSAATCTKAKTCSVCGTTTGKALGHNYKAATCTTPKTCTRCNKTFGEALGHTLNSRRYCSVCKKFIGATLTKSEVKIAKTVEYCYCTVSDWGESFDISFYFKDADYNKILNAKGNVKITITNNSGKKVYNGLIVFSSKNLVDGYYEIEIPKSEVLAGDTKNGTISCKIYTDYYSFTKETQTDDLQLSAKVKLPSTPKTISFYLYNGSKSSSCNITSITYELSGEDIKFTFAGKKTYDSDGSNRSSWCRIGYKLYDSDDVVIDSGTMFTEEIAVGEKFKEELTIYNVIDEPNKTYRLVLLDVS